MALRGETHARVESAVRGWIYEIQELGHSYETPELRLGLPPMGPPHSRSGLDLLRG